MLHTYLGMRTRCWPLGIGWTVRCSTYNLFGLGTYILKQLSYGGLQQSKPVLGDATYIMLHLDPVISWAAGRETHVYPRIIFLGLFTRYANPGNLSKIQAAETLQYHTLGPAACEVAPGHTYACTSSARNSWIPVCLAAWRLAWLRFIGKIGPH